MPGRPERWEGAPGDLARVATPPPAIAPDGGDDPSRQPRPGKGPVELGEIGVAHAGPTSLILQETLDKVAHAQHGGPHRWRRRRLGRVEWGVEKNQTGWELFWQGHVTNITCYDGYVTQPPP